MVMDELTTLLVMYLLWGSYLTGRFYDDENILITLFNFVASPIYHTTSLIYYTVSLSESDNTRNQLNLKLDTRTANEITEYIKHEKKYKEKYGSNKLKLSKNVTILDGRKSSFIEDDEFNSYIAEVAITLQKNI